MFSWVYLFSQFSSEALLLELFAISFLVVVYAGYWFIFRRRASEEGLIPAGVVKNYLNALIVDAEQLRSQLFGLLANGGHLTEDEMKAAQARLMSLQGGNFNAAAFLHTATQSATATGTASGTGPATGTGGADPAQLSALEGKLLEQSKALETLVIEKTRLEKDLEIAKSMKAAGAAAGGGDSALIGQLQQKINALEAKLSEYSVIEDDLANLKRLQQENAQLKASLAGGGAGAITSAATAPAAVTAAPVESPVAAATDSPSFEGLVDQVEQSLQSPPTVGTSSAVDLGAVDVTSGGGAVANPPSATPVAAAPAPAASAPTSAPAAATAATPTPAAAAPAATPASAMEKSDADLVAEFEKMLSG